MWKRLTTDRYLHRWGTWYASPIAVKNGFRSYTPNPSSRLKDINHLLFYLFIPRCPAISSNGMILTMQFPARSQLPQPPLQTSNTYLELETVSKMASVLDIHGNSCSTSTPSNAPEPSLKTFPVFVIVMALWLLLYYLQDEPLVV
ncbi:hypothetical protein V6N13_084160 [Hibiscus sabdariffa]